MAEAIGGRKAAEERLKSGETRLRALEKRLEEGNLGQNDYEVNRRRLLETMEEMREQNAKDSADREFALEQTRKKYQAELAQLSQGEYKHTPSNVFGTHTALVELQSHRDTISKVRDENRAIRSELDELQMKYDDE